MKNKILDELLELLEPRRPRFGIIRATLRINKIYLLRDDKWASLTNPELELKIRLVEQDRTIANLKKDLAKAKAKPKAKAKKKAKVMTVKQRKALDQLVKLDA